MCRGRLAAGFVEAMTGIATRSLLTQYLCCRWCCKCAVRRFCVGGYVLSRVPDQRHGTQDCQIEDDDHPAQGQFMDLVAASKACLHSTTSDMGFMRQATSGRGLGMCRHCFM